MARKINGMEVLRKRLRSMRNTKFDGYPDVRNGKFTSEHWGLTPKELDTLFEFAGIVPDEIVPNGSCDECQYAVPGIGSDWGPAGWDRPCGSCGSPKMTNFSPVSALTKKSFVINEFQYKFLVNVRDRQWWATGLVDSTQKLDSKANRAVLDRCHTVEKQLIERDMMYGQAISGRRLTQKGVIAMERYLANKGKKAA